MPSQAHLDILRQGVEVWNQWRNEHAARQLDLSGADLYRADLRGADLKGADLSLAILSEADLSQANLREDVMVADLAKTSHWVLPIYYYTDQAHLLSALNEHVIEPAERMAQK